MRLLVSGCLLAVLATGCASNHASLLPPEKRGNPKAVRPAVESPSANGAGRISGDAQGPGSGGRTPAPRGD